MNRRIARIGNWELCLRGGISESFPEKKTEGSGAFKAQLETDFGNGVCT